jgi:hypothetical protein
MTARLFTSRMAALVAILALAGVADLGCAGTTADLTGDGGQPWNGTCTQPGLFFVSAQTLTIPSAGTADLKVRLACDSQPYPGALVGFEIVGDGKGSQLSALSAPTDDNGVATVTLAAGTAAAFFSVRVSAEGADPILFQVTVSAATAGSILVHLSYNGPNTYTEYRTYLYANRQCATVDPFAISGALQEAPAVSTISATPQFVSVAVGTNYAVAVTARQGGVLLGFGCTGAVAVNGGQETDVAVAVEDIPITYSGTYKLDSHLDMSGVIPGDVGNIVHIFDEMSDDHAVDGSVGADQWGVDPAAFLLDFVYRQFCKWECTNANADFDNCTPGTHPTGDLKETYRGLRGDTPFFMWDGDQPKAFGLCGMLDPTWGMTQWVQNQVQGLFPATVINILDTVGDIARAIDQMHLKSTLTLNDVRPGRQGNFTHVLNTMVVDLHDLNGVLHTFEVDLAAAGVGNLSYSDNTTVVSDELQIPEHSFQLKFGKLVQYIYLNYLLPLLGCGAPNNTTTCLFAQIVNCQSVGTWLKDACDSVVDSMTGGLLTTCPVSATGFAGFCTAGLTAAGSYVDNAMVDWIGGETEFSLAGHCAADQIDSRRVAITLKDGVWEGQWDDGTANASFDGTFTGVRQ